jgi:hypothetical protein
LVVLSSLLAQGPGEAQPYIGLLPRVRHRSFMDIVFVPLVFLLGSS